eukprot:gene49457-34523_t
MRFCLTVQAELNEQEWPELGTVPSAATVEEDGARIYHGLRVRMGCHAGEAIKEAQGVGGQVMCTAEVHGQIEGSLAALGDPVIHDAGLRSLKGVAKPVRLYVAVPSHLAARLQQPRHSDDDRPALALSRVVAGLGQRLGMNMRRSRGTVCAARPHSSADPALSMPTTVLDAQCGILRGGAAASAAAAAFRCAAVRGLESARSEGWAEAVEGNAEDATGAPRERGTMVDREIERVAHALADHCAQWGKM